MDAYMAWQNEQLTAHSRSEFNITKDSDGVYKWCGNSAVYVDDSGTHWLRYNPGTLVSGGTYKLSYDGYNTSPNSSATTRINPEGSCTYTNGEMPYVNSSSWEERECTFSVIDSNYINFALGYVYGDWTYFKNIRLERLDIDDYDTEITSSTTMDLQSDHTLYAKWTQYTWEDYAADSYASGSGTAVSPYIIKTPAELAKLAKDSRASNLSGMHFKLGADIDLSEHYFASIGSASYRFAGTFDGAMHRIYHINTSSENSNGLFNKSEGVIRNLILSNSTFNIAAVGDGGGIVGEMTGGGIVENCIVDGVNILAPQSEKFVAFGTLVGANNGGTIKNCISKNSSIYDGRTSNAYVGGLVGWWDGGTIENCAIYGGQVITPNRDNAAAFIYRWGDGVTNVYYAQVNVITESKSSLEKVIYGDSNLWDGFFYNEQINDGYPIPKTLVSLGSIDVSSETIYNALIAKGFKSI